MISARCCWVNPNWDLRIFILFPNKILSRNSSLLLLVPPPSKLDWEFWFKISRFTRWRSADLIFFNVFMSRLPQDFYCNDTSPGWNWVFSNAFDYFATLLYVAASGNFLIICPGLGRIRFICYPCFRRRSDPLEMLTTYDSTWGKPYDFQFIGSNNLVIKSRQVCDLSYIN